MGTGFTYENVSSKLCASSRSMVRLLSAPRNNAVRFQHLFTASLNTDEKYKNSPQMIPHAAHKQSPHGHTNTGVCVQEARGGGSHLMTGQGTGGALSRHCCISSTYSAGKSVGELAMNCPSLM